jgi:hypothetical protein
MRCDTSKRHAAGGSSSPAASTHTSPLRLNARGNRQQRDCEQPG